MKKLLALLCCLLVACGGGNEDDAVECSAARGGFTDHQLPPAPCREQAY